jgi:hypothetical protein
VLLLACTRRRAAFIRRAHLAWRGLSAAAGADSSRLSLGIHLDVMRLALLPLLPLLMMMMMMSLLHNNNEEVGGRPPRTTQSNVSRTKAESCRRRRRRFTFFKSPLVFRARLRLRKPFGGGAESRLDAGRSDRSAARLAGRVLIPSG